MRQRFHWWVPLAALGALAAMELWKSSIPAMTVGQPYRDGIKERFAHYPEIVGNDPADGSWEGTSSELPPQAIALLHPNFYLSRRYVNRSKQWQAEMLFIEAEDTRDMMGHYPPNCYPGNGWDLLSSVPAANSQDAKAEWVVGALHIKGTEYEFRREANGREERLWVRDFFILPNNTFYAEIASFGRAASDFAIRPYGATQVQVIYRKEYLPADRELIFQSLIKAHMDLIDAVRKKD